MPTFGVSAERPVEVQKWVFRVFGVFGVFGVFRVFRAYGSGVF